MRFLLPLFQVEQGRPEGVTLIYSAVAGSDALVQCTAEMLALRV